MKVVGFDTQALLVFYLGESGSDMVENCLNLVLQEKVKGYMNVINLAELYYILRRISKETADEKERNLKSFGVKLIFDNSKLWKRAAAIKADLALSLADAFAAATAFRVKGTLVTGGHVEFDGTKDLKVEHVSTPEQLKQ
jgi:predicted nucleic acid-binding protein